MIFLDDFVGSGNQCVETWHRRYALSAGATGSFDELASRDGLEVYYCPLIACRKGATLIARLCPKLILSPAHILSDRYSAFSDRSFIWPDDMKANATDVIFRASMRAGIPESPENHIFYWKGYRGLGLALAFSHQIPDASLALFRWNRNGWQPLWRPA